MEGFIFRLTGDAVVKLSPPALAQMLEFRQTDDHSSEAGGVVLGRYILGCRNIVVDEVTTPMTGDRRTRFSFYRNHKPHQRVIDERWTASRGTCHYLGEWHTHPELWPTPSGVDLNDWRRRLRTDRFNGDSLLFIIVGIKEVRAWQGFRCTQEIRPLERIGVLGSVS